MHVFCSVSGAEAAPPELAAAARLVVDLRLTIGEVSRLEAHLQKDVGASAPQN